MARVLNVEVRVLGPADVKPGVTNYRHRRHNQYWAINEPGVYVAIREGENRSGVMLEGRLDPQAFEAFIGSIEENLVLDTVAYQDGDGIDTTREGWALRWVENTARWLRTMVQRELDAAVEVLTKAKVQLDQTRNYQ